MSSKARSSIRDVAALARVSVATVSRVTNDVISVDPGLAERVRSAVRKLNYVPDHQARALVSGRSRIIGLLISELTNPFFPELIKSFEDIAVEHGYEVIVGWVGSDVLRLKTFIDRMMQRKIEGIAVMTFGIDAPLLRALAGRQIPLVFIDQAPRGPLTAALRVNYTHGIGQAMRHLAQLGHTALGFISGPLMQTSAKLRLAAFHDSLKACSLKAEPRWTVEGDHTLEGGIRAMEKLIALSARPSAVMCSNDLTAFGAMRALAMRQIEVPRDISVVGFDDIHLAAFTSPALTTIGMSRNVLARCAFEALLESSKAYRSKQTRNNSSQIETTLVVRESTGAPSDDLLRSSTLGRR